MKSAAASRRKLLSRQLDAEEVLIVLQIFKAENLVAGRLGLAEALVKRGWLIREGRLVRLSDSTRALLAECVESGQ